MSPGIITVEKTFYICPGVLITRDNEKTLHKAKEPIRLRGKKLSNGNTSLFLDIYRDGRRSKEYLKLYLIPGKDAASKLQNEETLRTANAIKAQRVVAMQNNEHGFANPGLRAKVNFLDYLEHQAQRYEEAGSRAYARTVRNTIIHLTRYAGENITIGHVDKKYLSGFIDYLNGASSKYYHTDKEGTTRRRTLSQASRALYFNAVVIALNRAVKDDIIPSNPAHKIPEADRPKEGQATKEYLTLDEVQKLEATPCKYQELKRAFLFSCFCGLRMSDIRQLRWQDIHTTADGQKQVETRKRNPWRGKGMDKTIENSFFRWYRTLSHYYLTALHFIIHCINPPDELEESEQKQPLENEEFLKMLLSKLAAELETGNYEELTQFDRYSELWREVSGNLHEAISKNDRTYFYYLLFPFVPILNAYTDNSTEERRICSKWLQQETFLFPLDEELSENVSNLDEDAVLEIAIPGFALKFVSLVWEECNLKGFDFTEIANYFHIPTDMIKHFKLWQIVLGEKDKGYKYFPFFDNRLHGQQQEQPEFALPPELDTPRAREYFNKAEEAGFIAKTSTGYKWTSDNINECAYFCALCSDALNLSKRKNRDGERFTSWRPFSPVFGYSTDQLRNAKNEWRHKTGTMAEVYKEIEALFR